MDPRKEMIPPREFPCICCDVPVLMNMSSWVRCKKPVAVCENCDDVPLHTLRVIYNLKCHIAELKQDVRRLFTAQQEIEQDFLKRPVKAPTSHSRGEMQP
jgi:hypothetical protein